MANHPTKSPGQYLKPSNRPPSALRSFRAHLILWLLAAVGLTADLTSKHWAVETIGDPTKRFDPKIYVDTAADPQFLLHPVVIIEDYVRLITVYNRGAVAGLAEGKTFLLTGASIIAIILLLWFFGVSHANHWPYHTGIGMLLAGALGNLHDRLFNSGQVVDFIEVDLHFWPANPWPTFNIADALLCIGIAILLLSMLAANKHEKKTIPPNKTA